MTCTSKIKTKHCQINEELEIIIKNPEGLFDESLDWHGVLIVENKNGDRFAINVTDLNINYGGN